MSVILLFSLSFALDSLQMSCTVGGPYLPSSTVIVSGNITNSTGSPKTANVNLTVDSVTKSTQSDSNGAYFSTFSSLPVSNYTIAGIANASGFNNASCSANIQILPNLYSSSCVSRTILFTGTVIDSGSGNVITAGNVTSAIVGTNTTGSGTINSAGQFTVYINGCLYYSTPYVVNNIFDDNQGRRGWFDFIYVPT